MWNEMTSTDLSQSATRFDVPVYFFSGIHDYTVNHDLSKHYFESIEAPVKGFYTFDRSAHSPPFEEPQKVLRIMRDDVLARKTHLADQM